jgi:ribonuclease HII
MRYLIGTDEAGYAPNLGPLVISATVWEIDDGLDGATLYKHLRRLVTANVARATKSRIAWADSKVVYKGGNGIDHLERGVLAALGLVGRLPSQWCELWDWLDPEVAPRIGGLPWHLGYAAGLPFWTEAEPLAELVESLKAKLAAAGVRLVGILCRVVFPDEYNELVRLSNNKADALSKVTLSLVGKALQMIPTGSVQVFCDKHGGRNFYHSLLQMQFADDWIQVLQESGEVSSYCFGPEERRVEIGFHVGGERYLPVALASMMAKYLREVAMRPFNEFWCTKVPGLKPTAGYPVDAKRFKAQIAVAQQELAIDDQILWRSR